MCCEKGEQTVDHNTYKSADKEKMGIEINYLKRLLQEMEEKINILKENNTLLRDKITYLNLNKEIGNINVNTEVKTKSVVKKGVPIKTPSEEQQPKKLSQVTNLNLNKTSTSQKPIQKTQETNMSIMQNKQMEIMQEIINLEPSTSNRQHFTSLQTSPGSNMRNNYVYKQVLIDGNVQNKNAERITGHNRKTKRRVMHIGTAETEDTEKDFRGKERNKKVWLFISRVKDVTEEKIKNYIKNKTDLQEENDIVVEHIKTKYDIRRDCQCFKVGINSDKKEMAYDENFWPKKVTYRRFDFNLKSQAEGNKDKDF